MYYALTMLLLSKGNGVLEVNNYCYLMQEKDATVIYLKEIINIRHSEELKKTLLQALSFKKQLRVDLRDLNELDLSTLQLLYAAKKSADNEGILFIISPVSESAKAIIEASHILDELSI